MGDVPSALSPRIPNLPYKVCCLRSNLTLMFLFPLQMTTSIQGLPVFVWGCGCHSQPHMIFSELHERRIMDSNEPYFAQVFLVVVLLTA